MNRTALGIAALLTVGLSSLAYAQTGGNLPLVAVADGYNWIQSAEEYRIVVTPANAGRPLNLEVYSPGLNTGDYVGGKAKAGYYGDELYSKAQPFSTTFTLTGPDGKVFERPYGTVQEHTWERLLGSTLAAGTYTLRVVSSGLGKNAYALRVAQPFVLESSSFTVNARGEGDLLAARLRIGQEYLGKNLELLNYDGDGAGELELFALTPDGKRVQLLASDNGRSVVTPFPITQALLGDWSLVVRILPSSKQESNAFTFRLSSGSDPIYANLPPFAPPTNIKLREPLTVEIVDTAGRPIPGSSYTISGGDPCEATAILPSGYAPVSASVPAGKGQVLSSTQVRSTGCTGRVRFVARPTQGNLIVETVAIVGDRRIPLTNIPVTFNGRAYPSPANVPLEAGSYPITPSQLPDSTVEPRTGTVPQGGTGRVVLEYRPLATLEQTVNPSEVDYCGPTTVTVSARTLFPYAFPVQLKTVLPRGITTTAPLEQTDTLSADNPAIRSFSAQACESGSVVSTLEPFKLTATDPVRVRPAQGNLEVNTVAIIGNQRVPLRDIPVTIGGQTYKTPVSISVIPGTYNVTPTPLPDSTVQPGSGTVVQGQTGRVTLEYRVQSNLELLLSPDIVDYCGPANVVVRADTAFPYPIPARLKLVLPRGITAPDALELSGDISSNTVQTLQTVAQVCSPGELRATLEPYGLVVSGAVKLRAPAGLTYARSSANKAAGLTLTKKLERTQGGDGYTVNVLLTVERALDNVRLTDPLPANSSGNSSSPSVRGPVSLLVNPVEEAACVSVQAATRAGTPVRTEGNALNLGRLNAGRYLLVYTVFTDLTPDQVVTDPSVLWDDR